MPCCEKKYTLHDKGIYNILEGYAKDPRSDVYESFTHINRIDNLKKGRIYHSFNNKNWPASVIIEERDSHLRFGAINLYFRGKNKGDIEETISGLEKLTGIEIKSEESIANK